MSIAGEVADGLETWGLMRDLTFERTIESGDDGYGNPVTTTETFACRGVVEAYTTDLSTGRPIISDDIRALIPASNLAFTPALHDVLIVDGDRYTIAHVTTDALGAVWELNGLKT